MTPKTRSTARNATPSCSAHAREPRRACCVSAGLIALSLTFSMGCGDDNSSGSPSSGGSAGTSAGGSAQGGSTQGGSTQGGSAQGGSAQGGSSAGGSSSGGSAQGGSTSGGSAGSAQGGSGGSPQGGSGGSGPPPQLGDCDIFPADNPWNTDISGYPLHTNSDAFIDSVGRNDGMHPDFGTEWQGAPIGIPYVVVDESQPGVPITFDYDDESDPGPYPIPPNAPIEGGPSSDGDRHVLVVQTGSCRLFEVFYAFPQGNGTSWTAGSGAIFDLSSNALRPDGWTSADAAGLPILPGLVRYDETVEAGEIRHALRFTVSRSQSGYIAPATHSAGASSSADLPPMGLRLRMKSGYDCGSYSNEVQVICTALKRYGMFVADNGSDWYLSGAPDPRWSDDNLRDIRNITGDAFEVVETGPVTPGL